MARSEWRPPEVIGGLDSNCERLVELAAEVAQAVIEPLAAASFVQALDLADDEDS